MLVILLVKRLRQENYWKLQFGYIESSKIAHTAD